MAIFRKQVLIQEIKMIEGKTEIIETFNRYKDTFEDFIDSLDIELLNIPKLVDKGLYNIMLNSKHLPTKLKLDKNILDGSKQQ